ncbi:16 kDa calcium-binding protein [Schistosoma japonicum]|uniref:16 kDa calcium-binding protein n=1 Tax=Schistosoma japonicum TaxID=6182 RepID=Q5DES8_SCHJA|nr:SJCHGC04850 protein [Schistosoma japonicum]KAH8864198.1 16 kDa calcium-binding protein [Schistosoma japonicum]KAH8864199.1 16 kDa calcium-binding protein [Schistosoma japonicum]TNN05728.1 16 kDa calcium-binding protein [Schistosoma japonicum]
MDEILLTQFRKMDKDGNGTLSRREIRQCMKSSGFEESFIKEFIETFDLDGDGVITLEEYERVLNIIPQEEKEAAVWSNVFNDMDKDHSGKISVSELVSLLNEMGYEIQTTEIGQWMNKNKVNKDEGMDYQQFLNFMRRN